MKINAHILISGRVQGVWYRASTKQKAEQLGITGWVRNTGNGCVEAVFEGGEKQVNKMIEWCYQGPPLSEVDNLEITKNSFTGCFESFSIKN